MRRILLHHAVVPATVTAEQEERLLGLLPPSQVAGMARLRDRAQRLASLFGMALLRDCAAAAGLIPPRGDQLERRTRGKPTWPGGPDFSISHAAGRVACALAAEGGRVGLDLEPDDAATWEQLRFVASSRELSLYRDAGFRPAALWTAKEAVVKAAGLSAPDARRVFAMYSVARLDGRRYLLRRPRLAPGWACTVAANSPVEVLTRERAGVDLLATQV